MPVAVTRQPLTSNPVPDRRQDVMQTSEQADGFARTLDDVDAADDRAARAPSPTATARPEQRAEEVRTARDAGRDTRPEREPKPDREPVGDAAEARPPEGGAPKRAAGTPSGDRTRRRADASDVTRAVDPAPASDAPPRGSEAAAVPGQDAAVQSRGSGTPTATSKLPGGDTADAGPDGDPPAKADSADIAAALAATLSAQDVPAPAPTPPEAVPPVPAILVTAALAPPAPPTAAEGVSGIGSEASGRRAKTPAALGAVGPDAVPAGQAAGSDAGAVQASSTPVSGSADPQAAGDAAAGAAYPAVDPVITSAPKDASAAQAGGVPPHAHAPKGATPAASAQPAQGSAPPSDAAKGRAETRPEAQPAPRPDGNAGSAAAQAAVVPDAAAGRARTTRDEADTIPAVSVTSMPFQAMPVGVEVGSDTLKGLAATLSGHAAHGQAAAAQSGANHAAVPIAAVPVEIGMRALEGSQQFRLRLHPEDLGRVDVKLDIGKDGSVTAQLVVDKVETLAMLQRDARTLERAFDQAGLRTAENGLQFSLNSGAGQDQRQFRPQPDSPAPSIGAASSTKNELPEDLMAAVKRARSGPGGLDIRI